MKMHVLKPKTDETWCGRNARAPKVLENLIVDEKLGGHSDCSVCLGAIEADWRKM